MSTKNADTGVIGEKEGIAITRPTRDPTMGKHQSLKLLMILCYSCRQEPSITVLLGVPPAIDS